MAIAVRSVTIPIEDIEPEGSMSIPTSAAWIVLKDGRLAHPRPLAS